jgi:secreted PhoX family phosphatase
MSSDQQVESSHRPDDRPLGEIVQARLSRRAVLGGGLAAGVLVFAGTPPSQALASVSTGPATAARRAGRPGGLLGFAPVLPSGDDAVTVAGGYTVQVLIPWGQPLSSTGPAWNKDASNTAADQEVQVGMHHDGMHYFPLRGRGGSGPRRGLLVVNHEYVDRTLLYTDGDAVMTVEKVAKALAAHGVSVIELADVDGQWVPVDSPLNRRITGTTPMVFSGPVPADHPMLASDLGTPVQGTLNNCAHGATPWNTYLTCEENWHGYFGTEDPSWMPNPTEARYGVTAAGAGYRWHQADPRFDLARNPYEPNRFGWIVEIDPFDPSSTPVKRTALGRIKHEGATFAESRGRAVVYMGDDEDGDYFYKFVSARAWRRMRDQRRSPLDEGELFVAKFFEDGSGTWLSLVFGDGPLTPANGWIDQADVMLRTRQAADAVGATRLDRPEWNTVHPRTQDVFFSLTNGSAGPNGPNPRDPNPYGHIMRLTPERRDHTRSGFTWDVWMLAGDPAYDPQVELDETNMFGSPDGLWIDPDGRLWIQTDISNSSQHRADRGYDRIKNNQMLAADPATGEIRRFLVGPRGCEITGVVTTPDQETMFVNVQHPGEATTFFGSPTPDNPRAVSNWPDFDPDGRPRAATLAIRRIGGGKVGA